MKNIKTFCKENKDKIVTVGCVIGVAVIGALVYERANTKPVKNPYAGKATISWTPGPEIMNLERVKEVLDLNANNNEQFAIFKEGIKPDDYTCILISKEVITDKSEEA